MNKPTPPLGDDYSAKVGRNCVQPVEAVFDHGGISKIVDFSKEYK